MNPTHTILTIALTMATLHAEGATDSLCTTVCDSLVTTAAPDTTIFEPDGTSLPDVVVFGKMKRAPIPFPIRKPTAMELQKVNGGLNFGSLLGLVLSKLFPDDRRRHKETSKERAERLCRELDRIEPIKKKK